MVKKKQTESRPDRSPSSPDKVKKSRKSIDEVMDFDEEYDEPTSPTPIAKSKSQSNQSIKSTRSLKKNSVAPDANPESSSIRTKRRLPTGVPSIYSLEQDRLSKVNQAETKKKEEQHKRSFWSRFLISVGINFHKVQLKDPQAIEAVAALRLSPRDLRKLKIIFDSIDISGTGSIDATEFFTAMGEQLTPFTEKIFAIVDTNSSKTMEFEEFLRMLATICTLNQDEILRFCFQIFDIDGSGAIDAKEFIELCKCVHNSSPVFPVNFKTALEMFDVNEDGLIDYSEFVALSKRFPMMLHPAFRLQTSIQKHSLGEKHWLRVLETLKKEKELAVYRSEHNGSDPPRQMQGIWRYVLSFL